MGFAGAADGAGGEVFGLADGAAGSAMEGAPTTLALANLGGGVLSSRFLTRMLMRRFEGS